MNVKISPLITMADLMRLYPSAVAVLLSHQMACVGCNMSEFDTLAQAAATYEINLEPLIEELGQAIAAAKSGDSFSPPAI